MAAGAAGRDATSSRQRRIAGRCRARFGAMLALLLSIISARRKYSPATCNAALDKAILAEYRDLVLYV